MQMEPWIYGILIIGSIIGAGVIFSWVLGTLLEDILSMKSRNKFEEDMRLAIKHSQPSWEQIADIASTRSIKNAEIYLILQKIMREILTGKDTDISTHRSVVEGYLDKIKEIEPFEGIPTEIRIHLERIKEHLSEAPVLLQPLTSQIRQLLSVNEKEKRQQKYYTIGGFFVGFIGLIFAAFAYFYPYSNNHTATSNTQKNHSAFEDALFKEPYPPRTGGPTR